MVPARRHASWRPRERRAPDGNRLLATVVGIAVLLAGLLLMRRLGIVAMLGCLTSGVGALFKAFGPRATLRLQQSIDPEAGEIPVRVTYRFESGSAVLGSEDGALALVEGWLVFRGARTDWSVRREDARGSFAEGELKLVYPISFRYADVRLMALAPWGRGLGRRDTSRLNEMHEAWKRAKAVGESMYPPATAAPQVYRARRLPWGSAWGAGLCLALVSSVGAGLLVLGWPGFVAAAALLVAILVELRQRAEGLSALGPPRELGEGAAVHAPRSHAL